MTQKGINFTARSSIRRASCGLVRNATFSGTSVASGRPTPGAGKAPGPAGSSPWCWSRSGIPQSGSSLAVTTVPLYCRCTPTDLLPFFRPGLVHHQHPASAQVLHPYLGSSRGQRPRYQWTAGAAPHREWRPQPAPPFATRLLHRTEQRSDSPTPVASSGRRNRPAMHSWFNPLSHLATSPTILTTTVASTPLLYLHSTKSCSATVVLNPLLRSSHAHPA